MPKFKLVERTNHLALHALFDSRERAERHLRDVIPDYIARGYFMNKALRSPADFEILES